MIEKPTATKSEVSIHYDDALLAIKNLQNCMPKITKYREKYLSSPTMEVLRLMIMKCYQKNSVAT